METALIVVVLTAIVGLIARSIWTYISPYLEYKSQNDFKKNIEFDKKLEEFLKNLERSYLGAHLSEFSTLETIELEISSYFTKKEKKELSKINLDVQKIGEDYHRRLESGERILKEIGPNREERAIFKMKQEFLRKVVSRIKNRKIKWWLKV